MQCGTRLAMISLPDVQAQSVRLTFDGGPLSRQSLEDLAEILALALRLRRLTLCDILPSMIFVTSGVSALEELDLVDICCEERDLGKPLQVGHARQYPPPHYVINHLV